MVYPLLIVVPTLNSHTMLPRLVSSLQAQSYLDWHVLFVDGNSSSDHIQWLRDCCVAEPRCRFVSQDSGSLGIFGAMNMGFAAADDVSSFAEWLLFWGSDDWAASPTVLADAMSALNSHFMSTGFWPDLLVCSGRYANFSTATLGRVTFFKAAVTLTTSHYRRALLLGSTPPHQATLFGTGARRRLAHYDQGFRLSADLDYFLQLSSHPDLSVQCLDLELVHMGAGGISAQQGLRRLQEVIRAYRRAFGWPWLFSFFLRYLRRMVFLLHRSR